VARDLPGGGWTLLALLWFVTRKRELEAADARATTPQAREQRATRRTRRGLDPVKARGTVPGSLVAARALLQRGRGHYHMGGGAVYTAPDVFAEDGNRYPGATDCTGLLAYAAMYDRTWENTDGIVDDAKGAQREFRVVERDEPVRPGDFIVTDKGPTVQDHGGVIVEVLPGFKRLGHQWWKYLRVAQAAGQSWGRLPEQMEDQAGAVRITDAYRWRLKGVIIRPLHVTEG